MQLNQMKIKNSATMLLTAVTKWKVVRLLYSRCCVGAGRLMWAVLCPSGCFSGTWAARGFWDVLSFTGRSNCTFGASETKYQLGKAHRNFKILKMNKDCLFFNSAKYESCVYTTHQVARSNISVPPTSTGAAGCSWADGCCLGFFFFFSFSSFNRGAGSNFFSGTST